MTVLCFIDTETTGLDPRIHQPYEVSWWLEDEPAPRSAWLRHDLTHAEGVTLVGSNPAFDAAMTNRRSTSAATGTGRRMPRWTTAGCRQSLLALWRSSSIDLATVRAALGELEASA